MNCNLTKIIKTLLKSRISPVFHISFKLFKSSYNPRLNTVMRAFNLLANLVSAALFPTIQASWCQFYYDEQCMDNNANGGTSFDCHNQSTFGSGGRFIKCHYTKGNEDACNVERCHCDNCDNCRVDEIMYRRRDFEINSCVSHHGAGPWYRLSPRPGQ